MRNKFWFTAAMVSICLAYLAGSSVESSMTAGKSSFHETLYFVANTKTAPLDNVLVRYALALATDRQAITDAVREPKFSYIPGSSFVPPYDGYELLHQLEVEVDGKKYDLLSYNPNAAQEFLAKAGFPEGLDKHKHRLTIEMLVSSGNDKLTDIVKRQWQQILKIDVIVISREWHKYLKLKDERNVKGVALDGESTLLASPVDLFDFATGQVSEKPYWVDQTFNKMLLDATHASVSDPHEGNIELRNCEKYLLRSMAVIPLYSRTPK